MTGLANEPEPRGQAVPDRLPDSIETSRRTMPEKRDEMRTTSSSNVPELD